MTDLQTHPDEAIGSDGEAAEEVEVDHQEVGGGVAPCRSSLIPGKIMHKALANRLPILMEKSQTKGITTDVVQEEEVEEVVVKMMLLQVTPWAAAPISPRMGTA